MTDDNDDALRHAKSIRQFELREGTAPIHAESDTEILIEENHSGERFLYVVDGDGNAGYVPLTMIAEMDLESSEPPELTPEERVEDWWDRKHGVLPDDDPQPKS